MKTNFSQMARRTSSAQLRINARACAGVQQVRGALRTAAVKFAKHQPLYFSRVANHSRTRDPRSDVGHAAHHRSLSQNFSQQIVPLHPILKRKNRRLRRHDFFHGAHRGFRIPQFHAEKNVIRRAKRGRIVARARIRNVYIAELTLHAQAVLTDRGKMRPACHEADLAAALRQLRAEITAYAARPDNGDAHVLSPPLWDYFAVGRGSPSPV